jgi:hypothetical protein
LFSFLFLDHAFAVNVDIGTVGSIFYKTIVEEMCGKVESSSEFATLLNETQGYDLYIGTLYDIGTSNIIPSGADISNNDIYTVVVGFKRSNTSC